MATITDLNTRIDAALAAMDAKQWAAVQTHCNAALLIIAAIPATQFDGADQIRFDPIGATAAIKTILADARARGWNDQAAAQLIEYRRG
jgi:hypothetical protein